MLETGRRRSPTSTGRPIARRAARHLLRRLRHLRRLLALPGRDARARAARTDASTASPRRADDGLLGGWARAHRAAARACVCCRCPTGLDVLDLHGWRLRPADRVPCGRARGHSPRRHGRGAGQRPRRPQRARVRAARGRSCGCWWWARRLRGSRRPLVAWGPRTCSTSREVRDPAARARFVLDPHPWPRRRRGDRGFRPTRRRSVEGLEMVRDAGRYVIVGQYTDAGDADHQPAPPPQPAPRRPCSAAGATSTRHLHRSVETTAKHPRALRLGAARLARVPARLRRRVRSRTWRRSRS